MLTIFFFKLPKSLQSAFKVLANNITNKVLQ